MKINAYTQAISRIVLGYFLLYFNINLGTLNILPDWLGYLCILRALKPLAEKEPSASLLEPLALILLCAELLRWVLVLVGFTADWPLFVLLTGILSLYFHFQLLTNLASAAASRGFDKSSNSLLRARTAITLLRTLLALSPVPWVFEGTLGGVIVFFLGFASIGICLWLCGTLYIYAKEEKLCLEEGEDFADETT